MDNMVKNFSQMAFISAPGKGLPLYPQSSDDEDSDEEGQEEGVHVKKKKKDKGQKRRKSQKRGQKGSKSGAQGQSEAFDVQNLYSEDPSKYFCNSTDFLLQTKST